MSQYLNLNPKGLFTYYNNLSEVSPGALLKGTNTVLNRNGVINPRRGIKYYGPTLPNLADRAKQLMQYKDTLIRHVNDKLAFEVGAGVFTDFEGDFTEVITGERTKYLENKGNLYFTSSEGVQKISVKDASEFGDAVITQTGAPAALGGYALPNYSTLGFLNLGSQVPYQVTWSIKDANNLLIEGVPSEIIVCKNESPTSDVSVDLTVQIPSGVNEDYILRIYRAEQSLLTDPLKVTYNLVFEGNPETVDIILGYITYTDFVNESFRNAGEPLYTNATSEGISQANYRPPSARDIELFNNSVFYANTREAHQKNFSMITSEDLLATTKITIADNDGTYTVQFRGQTEQSTIVVQQSSLITDHSFFLVNSANNERRYFVWFDKSGDNITPEYPEHVGRFPLRIDVSTPMTAIQVGTEIENTLANLLDFAVTSLLGIVSFFNLYNGYADATADSVGQPTNFTFTTLQQGLGQDASLGFALLSNKTTDAERIAEMTKSLVDTFTQMQNKYIVKYTSTFDSIPGIFSVMSSSLVDMPFYITTNEFDASTSFSPALNVAFTNTTATVSPLACTLTTSAPHGLVVGDKVFIYNFKTNTSTVSGQYTVTAVPTSTTYTINLTILSLLSAGFVTKAAGASENNATINSLYFSKDNQPESVPLVNQILVGSSDAPILRIKALRESLFIFKTDGLFRLSGFSASDFVVQLFDNTVILKCPDSVASLSNEIYCFANQGVVKISEVGKDVISKPIYDKLIPFITTNTNLAKATFGVAYESDRSYILFTVKSKLDTTSTVAYRYNVDTDSWTDWDVHKTCGILKQLDDKLYFGSAIANTLEQERKDFNRFDYADREIILSLAASSLTGNIIKPSNFETVAVNDVITQTQYVTLYQFNQLLKKLDLDNGINSYSFFANLAAAPGGNLSSYFTSLVTRLNIQDTNPFVDTHGNTSYVFNGSSDFASIQTQYNAVIDRLNESPTLFLSNYAKSLTTTLQEAIVLEKDTTLKQFTLEKSPSFIQGPILIYKGINTEIEFVPQHGGDPSTLKQFSSGTILLENRSFYSAYVGFNSDLSVNYDNVLISPVSYGNWGDFTWGTGAIWGGQGDRAPLRTYIPAKKQRCRFIGARFSHGIALQSFSLYGLSLTFTVSSERAYK
jgi:hypothetical protein